MKSKELMLGDYVQVNNEVCEVISISYFDIGISDNNENFYREHIDNIKPIPLTSEILEKNGFDISDKEVMQYHFEEDGEKYHFSLRQMYDKDGKPHGYSFYAFNVLTLLDYVHELQHALRLCEIEKKIKL